jgi:hypothetical protein
MASIRFALRRIKQDPLGVLKPRVIQRACEEQDYHWRERQLDPVNTIRSFVQQVTHGNAPCSEVRRIVGGSFTPSAYCQARARLPLKVYQSILFAACEAAMRYTRQKDHLWRGHRTFHIDGSTFSMPDTPELVAAFGTPSGQTPGCGFPVAHLLVLFSASTGLLLDAWASPLNTGDITQTPEAHLHLEAGDVLIGDDSFGTYVHLALLLQANLHGLFPVHHARVVDFTPGRAHTVEGNGAIAGQPRSEWIGSLGEDDQLVRYFKPCTKPRWMDQTRFDQLPESIVVRELRRIVHHPEAGTVTLTMVTTLIDAATYPAQALLELRMRRWDVETNIGHLKTTMKMDVLRCKSEDGIRKELVIFCLVYNLVRVVMLDAAGRQRVPVSRISFADTLYWLRHARPGDEMPRLLVNPHRPHRLEPRCRKRRPKKYDLMTKPRRQMRETLKKQRKNA